MSRPRVLVSGYYGFGNAGDEAILAGLLEGFRQLLPQADLLVLSGNPQATEREHGVKAVPRSLRGLRSHLRNADLFISGGGGLLQDTTSWRSPLYYLATIRLARAARVPVACVGHSIGPLRRRWVRALVRRHLSTVDVLAVRDQASAEALRALGVHRPVAVTADFAFALHPPSPDESSRAWQHASLPHDSRPAAAICLRRPPGRPDHHLAASLAASIARASRPLGLRLLLLPMQHPQDLAFAEQVARAMPASVEIVQAKLTARQLLALIAGFELVIAMRLHALIFAAICGRPPVAISYDPKVEGMMHELGLPTATSASGLHAEALGEAIRSAFQNREAIARAIGDRVAALRAAALRNIELAAALVT